MSKNNKFYMGTKNINGTPMNRADYNDLRGWDLPDDEDGSDEGYLVEYLDGGKPNHPDFLAYISWSPKEQFENAYQVDGELSFGHAIEMMRLGFKVARSGWNGKGINIFIVDNAKGTARANAFNEEGGGVNMQQHIVIDTTGLQTDNDDAPKSVVPWLASQTDMLANDWSIVD